MDIRETKVMRFLVIDLHENVGQIPGVPANPRTISKEKYEALLESLRAGDLTGVLPMKVYQYNGEWVVLGGNMRLRAMRELGITDVSGLLIPDNTDQATLRKIAMLDNATFGVWDWDLLANEWDMDELAAAGIDFPFLDDNESPTNTEARDVEEDDFDETQDEIKARCQAGDLWLLGEHKLLCGDSTKAEDIARLLGDEKADLWITDPPYNVNYEGGTDEKLTIANDNMNSGDFFQFLYSAFSVAEKALKKGCSFYIWYASREHINFETALIKAGLNVREQLIWNKSSLVLGRFDYHYKHEPCLYGWKDGQHYFTNSRGETTVIQDLAEIDPKKMKKEELVALLTKVLSDQMPTTVLDYDKPTRSEGHPTMKPVALFDYLIRNSSKKHQIVLDTFAGSGTTIMACEQNGRRARCVELAPGYADVIIRRWQNFTGKEAKLIHEAVSQPQSAPVQAPPAVGQ